jgi:glycine cleavage system H lipoate-binding protein
MKTVLRKEIVQTKLKEFVTLTDSFQNELGKIFSSELNDTISKLKQKEEETNHLEGSKIFWILTSTLF